MPTIYLISATPGDHVPGHELADPDCPEFPGLLERADVTAWLDAIPYNRRQAAGCCTGSILHPGQPPATPG